MQRAHVARTFVHEFAHLRYGVFDEYLEVSAGGTVPKCPANQHEGGETSKASIMARTDEDEVSDTWKRYEHWERVEKQNVEMSLAKGLIELNTQLWPRKKFCFCWQRAGLRGSRHITMYQ